MHSDPLDRDFSTFRATRDPAALAAVFDAAAPRLLLVAMHLCRDAATAEDLVQTVFLQVLRDAGQFDARRPVMPWLLGLLEHRASDLRRRAHVRREQAGATTNAVTGEPGPDRTAAAAEARARIAEALAGMPAEYRDVLALRLVHDLSSVEIAHAHGLPPATVRTRLRRGLTLLRGALPRGLATPGLLALLMAEFATARDGLGTVRTKVLAAAAAGSAVSFAFGTWLVLAAALLLAAGSTWWFAVAAPASPHADPAAPVAATQVANDGAANLAGSDRDDAAPTANRVAVTDARLTTIRGRVVAGGSGQPLGGVQATLTTHANDGVDETGWRDPEAVATSSDGAFAVRFVPSRHRGVELALTADGYVDEFLSWEPLREGVEVDTGDVQLGPGTPVRLRIVCDGAPLAGVEVSASHAPEGTQPNGLGRYGRSDADGIVDLGTCEPGAWWHDVESAHLGAEARFDVPLQRAPFVATVELREPPRERSISGLLVDERGLPMAGVQLALPWPGGGRLTATTRADGGFLWSLATPPPAHVRERIELVPPPRAGGVALGLPPRSYTPRAPVTTAPALAWLDDGGPIAWGTHDLRLVVRRLATATLRLEVADAATQQPIETFGATCHAHLSSGSAERRRVAPAHHPGGCAAFEVAPGAWFASVFPDEPFAESAELPV